MYYSEESNSAQNSPDYGRLVSGQQVQRLKSYFDEAINDGARLVIGGDFDVDKMYVGPTVLVDVPLELRVMQEEIFGPILPVISFSSIDKAIQLIKNRPKPLALYIFTRSSKTKEKIISETSSGSVCINDCVIQIAPHSLPFGGVGPSGMGKYRGHYSFLTFSNQRAIADHVFNLSSVECAMCPPFSSKLTRLQKTVLMSTFEVPFTAIKCLIIGIPVLAAVFVAGFFIGKSMRGFE